jgi:hypothetical protein
MSATPPTPANSPEYSTIIRCLSRIRRRHWSVRLLERSVLALQWSSALSLFLTSSYLLRHPLPWENYPWTAMLLSLIPIAASAWLLRRAPNFPFIRLATALTALLSCASLVLLFWPKGLIIEVWMVPTATISAFVILAAASVRRLDFRAAAIYVDQQVGLHERVSTALELLQTPVNSQLENAFRAPVIASALDACIHVSVARIAYGRLNSRHYSLAALLLLVALGATYIPATPARAQPLKKPNVIAVKQATDLHELLKELAEKQPPNDKTTQNALKPLENAVTKLQDGTMSPIESSAVLNEARAQLQKEQELMAAADKVADALKAMNQTRDFAQAAQGMKNAEAQKGDGTISEQQKTAAEAMKGSAQAMADKMSSGKMSEDEKKDLADQLQAAADKASGDPQLQKDLQTAADAARQGNSQQLASSMQSAGQRMAQQSAANHASQNAINRAMAEIDKMQSNSPGSQSTMGAPGQQTAQNSASGGQNGDQNPGNSGQSGAQANAGGQPGDGQGGGSSPPKGQAPGGQSNRGDGSTMMEQRGAPDRLQGQPLGGQGTFVRIYDASATETKGNQEKVGSRINPLQAPAVGTAEVFGPADKNSSTIKTYSDVLPDARQQALEELNRQDYPPPYQDLVRQFYSEPAKK